MWFLKYLVCQNKIACAACAWDVSTEIWMSGEAKIKPTVLHAIALIGYAFDD